MRRGVGQHGQRGGEYRLEPRLVPLADQLVGAVDQEVGHGALGGVGVTRGKWQRGGTALQKKEKEKVRETG